MAIEDKRFFDHKGVDPTAILRALVNKWSSGSEEGGSTITQQLIKNTLIGDEHSYQRKLKEAALAYQLEKRWSKEKILAEYLNTIYFGHGNYGVETAARYYFGKGANNLEAEEAALLAAIPKAPSLFDPVEHPAAARERRNLVIDEMVDQGYLSPEAGLVAKSRAGSCRRTAGRGLRTTNRIQPYFVDYVIQQLERKYGERTFTGGFQVYTTLDLAEQEQARESRRGDAQGRPAAPGGLARLDRAEHRQGARDGGRVGLRQEPVQHRHERPAPAGLGVQAVRAAGRARGRHPDLDALHLGQAALRPRQPPGLVRHQLHASRTRARSR